MACEVTLFSVEGGGNRPHHTEGQRRATYVCTKYTVIIGVFLRFFFEVTSPGGKLKYQGGTFFFFFSTQGEINIPGESHPGG